MKRVVTALTAVVLACGVSYGQEMPSNYENLKCYDQLIGTWVYDGELLEDGMGMEKDTKFVMRVSYRWILNKNAVGIDWSADIGDVSVSGKGLIGWDVGDGKIISGGMDSMGGHSLDTGTYDAVTKTWSDKSKGVDGQGESTSATVVMTLTDPNTLVWQMRDRKGGGLIGDSPKYTFKRVKRAKQPIRLKKAK